MGNAYLERQAQMQQYSKQSEYVHSPVAHALYHTWKKVDEDGRRKERQ